jgi:hypothetical protein
MNLKQIASFIRWRITAWRYLYALFFSIKNPTKSIAVSSALTEPPAEQPEQYHNSLEKSGFISLKKLIKQPQILALKQQLDLLATRYVQDAGNANERGSKPFVNILDLQDISKKKTVLANQLVEVCFNPSLLHLLDSYLGAGFVLDSIQLLYSFSVDSEMKESQYWHKDYGSSKSIHLFLPVSNMREDSPFTVMSPQASQAVGKRPWVRRISPTKMTKILGNSSSKSNLLLDSDIIALDPAKCYHRYCSTRDHAALFITYNARPLFHRQDNALLLAAPYLRQIALENHDMSEDLVNQILLVKAPPNAIF